MVYFGTSQRCFEDPFADAGASPTAAAAARSSSAAGGPSQQRLAAGSQSPTRRSLKSPTRSRSTGKCFPSTGKLVMQGDTALSSVDKKFSAQTLNVPRRPSRLLPTNKQPLYDTRRGVTAGDLSQRAKMLQEAPVGKWQRDKLDLPAEVSDKLEKAFIGGDLKIGLWDNGLFRDFDLAKMQEIPGLRQLQRVSKDGTVRGRPDMTDWRPSTCPAR